MTYTRHGHDIPGTPAMSHAEVRKECGGVGHCMVCTLDAAAELPAALARLQARVAALEKQIDSAHD